MTMYYFQDAKVQSIFQIRMDFLTTNIDYFAAIEIPTLSLNCLGETPTSFLK